MELTDKTFKKLCFLLFLHAIVTRNKSAWLINSLINRETICSCYFLLDPSSSKEENMLISLIISSIFSIGTPLALSRVGKLTHYRHIIPMILLSVPTDSQQILTEGPILLHQFVRCLVQGVK